MYFLLDTLLLGSYADLEWLSDLSWNMGSMMISEQHCDSPNVFDELPSTSLFPEVSDGDATSPKYKSKHGNDLKFMK